MNQEIRRWRKWTLKGTDASGDFRSTSIAMHFNIEDDSGGSFGIVVWGGVVLLLQHNKGKNKKRKRRIERVSNNNYEVWRKKEIKSQRERESGCDLWVMYLAHCVTAIDVANCFWFWIVNGNSKHTQREAVLVKCVWALRVQWKWKGIECAILYSANI